VYSQVLRTRRHALFPRMAQSRLGISGEQRRSADVCDALTNRCSDCGQLRALRAAVGVYGVCDDLQGMTGVALAGWPNGRMSSAPGPYPPMEFSALHSHFREEAARESPESGRLSFLCVICKFLSSKHLGDKGKGGSTEACILARRLLKVLMITRGPLAEWPACRRMPGTPGDGYPIP